MKLLPPVKCSDCQANVEHIGCTRAKVCRLCGNTEPQGFGFMDGDRFCQWDVRERGAADCLNIAEQIRQEQEDQDKGESDPEDSDDVSQDDDAEDGEGDSEGEGSEDSESGSEGDSEAPEGNSEDSSSGNSEGDDADSGEGDSDQGEGEGEQENGEGAADGQEGDHSQDFRDPHNTDNDRGRTVDTAVTYAEFDEITDLKAILVNANKRNR